MITIQADNYPVYIGKYSLTALGEFLVSNFYSKIFIMVDENTCKYCLPDLIIKVPKLEKAEIIETESGEDNKSIEVCVQIWKAMTELGADRKSLLINLGGGVISDMGGFAASVFKRGMDYINLPTTLLSMVDASVGGKTGLNLDNQKNQVGTFSNPKAVFIYPPFLNSLKENHFVSGFAEVAKHALIADNEYWEAIKKLHPLDADEEKVISRSVEIKNNIVSQDPDEKGLRKILNFGHTVGHAIESFFLETGNPVEHGEAIAAGMFCEAFLSYKISGLKHTQLDEICNFLLKNFSVFDPSSIEPIRLLELMQHDKKNESGIMLFSLIEKPGAAVFNVKVSSEMVLQSIEFYKMRAALVQSGN
jgi:3-dehydroquinate synthase